MKVIDIKDIEGVSIGQTENKEAGTGCTVVLCRDGARAGIDVRGGGPASRDTRILDPLMAAQQIHAVVLAGGSAFGLGAADGVMRLLEERGIGFDVGVTKVPLVPQSDIFDLTDGDSIYALSVGSVKADPDVVGALAAEVVSMAIIDAVQSAESAYGFPAAKDL